MTGFDFDPYDTIPDADINYELQSNKIFKPEPVIKKRKREGIQLCKFYNPNKPPNWTKVIIERKLDCYRCIAIVRDGKAQTLTSTGLPHWNTNFILSDLEDAAASEPWICDNIVLDGEIVHDTLPFDIAGGILRQHEPHPEAGGFKLHAWDILPVEDFDSKSCFSHLITRKEQLRLYMEKSCFDCNSDHVMEHDYYIGTLEDVEPYAREFVLEDGEEGIVIKDAYGMYEYRKSNTWLKWKPTFENDSLENMLEGDFRIVNIKKGRGKHNGRVGSLLIEGYLLEDGNISPDSPDDEPIKKVTGKAGTGLDDAQRIDFMNRFNEGTLLGSCVEVHYQELSSKGKVRFPVFYRLRPDRD
jgi:ATP-dependent DNA ligase